MKFAKTLIAAAALAASFAAGAQVTGTLGGGTGNFLSLSGGAAPVGPAQVQACAVGTPCTLGGALGTIVGGSTLTGDANFADAEAFASNGGLFGGRFLAAGPSLGQPSLLTFNSAVSYISFLWGSPDLYNQLTVTSSNGIVQTFDIGGTHGPITPTNINLMFSSSNGSQSFSQYVQFVAAAGTTITSLMFNNSPSVNAFEVANFSITRAVPEPETYALMLAGLGALGFISRRRKRV